MPERPVEEFYPRIERFREAVFALPEAQLKKFLRAWPTFPVEAVPLGWTDEMTVQARRFWREATGRPLPDAVDPLTWEEVIKHRDKREAHEFARRVQTAMGLVTKTKIEVPRVPGAGRPDPNHANWNDLNETIFHDERDFLHYPDDALTFWAGHEIGHSRIYPATHHRMLAGVALIAQHDDAGRWRSGKSAMGKRPDLAFLNWLGDTLINNKQQYDTRHGDAFHRGMLHLLTTTPARRMAPDTPWVLKMHFRLMWAHALLKQGHLWRERGTYHVTDPGDAEKWEIPSPDKLPPVVLAANGMKVPQITFDDGKAAPWAWGGKRLVKLWKVTQVDARPSSVETVFPQVLELVEPYFFPPPPPPPPGNPDNPDGVACPVCGKSDRFRPVGFAPDPLNPREKLERWQCAGCKGHERSGLQGRYVIDPAQNMTRKEANAA